MSKKLLSILLLFTLIANAQIINTAPYILTVTEAKAWTTIGATASTDLIATEPLATRFVNTATQTNPLLPNTIKIAYLPDGMNNFGNYYGEQSQFNLYNFTNWQYIDKLVWFGGTASQSVQIPSSPWVNAAHKNGVKVFGNVFFAPNVFGGSTATLNDFLEQDISGNFIIVPKMVQMMQYYNFDGWFINEETSTDAATALKMYSFLKALTAQVEAVGKETIWYDSMVASGNISYQNRLNQNNSLFVQNDEDSDLTNGYETRVSSNIFINFFWSSSVLLNVSRNRANLIGRSPYEVFSGVDIWPGRNQAAFETGGNTWMNYFYDTAGVAYTSLGFFAPNCVFNSSQYSNFNNDPTDYNNFYRAERHLFSGSDRNPVQVDAIGFKGVCNWVPENSVVSTLPFVTDFSTGHGLKKFAVGVQTSANPWHNMNEQDVLPTWQFGFSSNNLTADWDFENGFNKGNSLNVSGNLVGLQPVDLMLYKTKLLVASNTEINIAIKSMNTPAHYTSLLLVFADNVSQIVEMPIPDSLLADWSLQTISLNAFEGREIAKIGFRFAADVNSPTFSVNLGKIEVWNNPNLNVASVENTSSKIKAYYTTNEIRFDLKNVNQNQLSFKLYDVSGKVIQSKVIRTENEFVLPKSELTSGIYFAEFSNEKGFVERVKIGIE